MVRSQFDLRLTSKTLNLSLLRFNKQFGSENLARGDEGRQEAMLSKQTNQFASYFDKKWYKLNLQATTIVLTFEKATRPERSQLGSSTWANRNWVRV